MNTLEADPERLEAEATYEVGMLIGTGFFHGGVLDEGEFAAFQAELVGLCAPLTGGLDEGCSEWINPPL